VSAVAVVSSAAVGVGIGVALGTLTPTTSDDTPASPAAPSSDSSGVAPIAAETPSAIASNSTSVSASAVAVAAPPEECALRAFPSDTFRAPAPPLGFVCDTPTFPASRRLKKLVVQSGAGSVNDAMREWSQLGYYQLAATAVLQQRCCASPPDYDLPPLPKECRFGPALDALRSWVRSPVDEEIDALTQAFTKAARCVARGVEGKAFQLDAPAGGQDVVFRKTIERLR
jgi:hypothetical protein